MDIRSFFQAKGAAGAAKAAPAKKQSTPVKGARKNEPNCVGNGRTLIVFLWCSTREAGCVACADDAVASSEEDCYSY
jgi:hypothetical protein